MKSFWISCAILAALSIALLLNVHYLSQFLRAIDQQLDETSHFAYEEEWDKAIDLATQAKEKWHQKDVYLRVTLRHAEVDQINRFLEEMIAYLNTEEIQKFTASHALLRHQLLLLYEAETLTLQNIL